MELEKRKIGMRNFHSVRLDGKFCFNIIFISPAYIVKRCIQGNFCERLYRRKSSGNCGVYYRDKGDGAADGEAIWGK